MITTGWCDNGLCVSGSKVSTDDDAMESVGEYCSILRPGLRSLEKEMDGIESWSVNESIESRLSPLAVVTETETPPLFFM